MKRIAVLLMLVASVSFILPSTSDARGYTRAKLTRLYKHDHKLLVKALKTNKRQNKIIKALLDNTPPTNNVLQGEIAALQNVDQDQNNSVSTLWNYSQEWAGHTSCLLNNHVRVGRYDSAGNPDVSNGAARWLDFTAFHNNVSQSWVFDLVYANGC